MKHADRAEALLSLVAELIAKDDTYSVKSLAKDTNVRETGTLCGAFSIHTQVLAEYIKRYGYDLVNDLVIETSKCMEEVKDDGSKRSDSSNESVSEAVSY